MSRQTSHIFLVLFGLTWEALSCFILAQIIKWPHVLFTYTELTSHGGRAA